MQMFAYDAECAPMSLKHAILVLLENKPGSGYDLMGRFNSGIGHFWNSTHQQVYQELKRLHEEGCVEFEVETQAERPDKKNYRITRAGKKALAAWLAEPVAPPQLRDALLVKIYAAHLGDKDTLVAELDRHLALHRGALEEYRQIETDYFSLDDAGRRRLRLPYLTLRRGIRYELGSIEWFEEARTLLADDGLPKAPVLSKVRRKKT